MALSDKQWREGLRASLIFRGHGNFDPSPLIMTDLQNEFPNDPASAAHELIDRYEFNDSLRWYMNNALKQGITELQEELFDVE